MNSRSSPSRVEKDTRMKKATVLLPSEAKLASQQRAHDVVAERQYATELRFVRKGNVLRLRLRSGAIVELPIRSIVELAKATPRQVAKLELLPTGAAIEQRELDVDLSVPGLLRDIFGFGELQQIRAARSRTPVKAAAARANGAKGGRHRKESSQGEPALG